MTAVLSKKHVGFYAGVCSGGLRERAFAQHTEFISIFA